MQLSDLNTCLLKHDNRAKTLHFLTSSVNLYIIPMTNPTHYFLNCRPSLIDLAFVSNPNFVLPHKQMTSPFSYHDLIFVTYKVRPPKIRGKVFFQHNFKQMGLQSLIEYVKNIDWSSVFTTNDINTMVESLTIEVIKIYDIHAPIRPVRMKLAPAPWLTPDIRKTMDKRGKAKNIIKKFQTQENLSKYKILRNLCNRMCRDAKRHNIHDSVQNLIQAQVWKFLQPLGVGKPTEACQSSVDLNALSHQFITPSITDCHVKTSTLP
ncbi:unnamed protein product [Euphydryas editha]|uniref:Uncharacterized protein n=1 Tax=Euphydryas editha TaxID=104508 RepID=A0AAU9V891_EUPED|nr:unnamed protein product [Euphydryas editha]